MPEHHKGALFLLSVAVAVVSGSVLLSNPLDSGAVFAQNATTAESNELGLFAPIAATIRSPRCMNCHTTTEFPRQNDDRRPHRLGVIRGPDNHGSPGMQCSACHNDTNNDVAGVPGAPHWGLAPLSMAWEYMTAPELCAQLKDPARNGGKTLTELHEHMVGDPLVLWAWAPGKHPDGTERSLPPVTLSDWKIAMRVWIDAGGPCPNKEDQP